MAYRGNFGSGFDQGTKTAKWIGFIIIGALAVWFLYMGFNVVSSFDGFGW